MRRFCYCDPATGEVLRFENLSDGNIVDTALGPKRADQISGSSKASIAIPGSSGDGGITYTARHGGKVGNNIRIEHSEGATGIDNKDRTIDVTVDGCVVTITFGTDSVGDPITPTAANIVSLIENNESASKILTAAVVGDGSGEVSPSPPMPLVGGKDNGDWRKFRDRYGTCHRVNTVEVI